MNVKSYFMCLVLCMGLTKAMAHGHAIYNVQEESATEVRSGHLMLHATSTDFKLLGLMPPISATPYKSALRIHRNARFTPAVNCPQPSITPAGPFCADASAVQLNATPSGGTWSGTGIVNTSTGLFDPAVAGGGVHQIIYTYTDTCTAFDTIAIEVGALPEITFISGDGLNCYGDANGNILVTVEGGTQIPGPYPYLFDWDWDQTAGNDDYSCGCPSGEPEDLSGLSAGVYTVTVTDALGCTATSSASVTQPSSNITVTGSDLTMDCYGQTDLMIDITVNGGTPNPFTNDYIYDWDWDGTGFNDDIGGPADPEDDEQDPQNVEPGSYSVTVTDFLGCTGVATINITEPDSLTAQATTDDVDCSGNGDGSIDLTVAGGTGPYSFDWDNDGTGDNDDPEDLTGLSGGTYAVTVTDANGCTTTAEIEVMEPLSPVDASAVATELQCFGDDNGSIDLTPGGGTGAFTFDWSNDGTGDNDDPEDLTNLTAGTYSVTVTDANGCTVVVSVTLQEPPELTGTLDTMICAGGSVVINGTTYDDSNTSGTEVFVAGNGCDSTVTVNVSFAPPLTGTFTNEACEGDGYSIIINGTTYDESNPSGTETLTTPDGCDSIVTINLSFVGAVTGDETYTGCAGDGYSVVVNGMTYDESNPTGTETLQSAAGCDSIVTINLTFNGNTTFDLVQEACQGDGTSITVGNTVYDESNPTGTETLVNSAGCDSIVNIDLQFGEPSSSQVTYQGCEGDGYSVVVNGTTYDESNPSGTEILTNADGCDSTIQINLQFTPIATGEELYDGCIGDGYSVVVNGTVYDESNPMGTETITTGDCDSIVTINLQFNDVTTGEENYTGCTGDGYSVEVNGTVYDESNPTGTETITTGNCDSIVTINLQFNDQSTGQETYSGCQGDGYWVEVGGTIYNEFNPTGTETLTNAQGCDSVVTINLQYLSGTTGDEFYEGCSGDGYSVNVNGTVYDESNPTGTETMPGSNGCDSVILVNLLFHPEPQLTETHNGCIGDGYSVVVNGTVYDESNPTGIEVMQTQYGCDSTVTIDLQFNPEVVVNINSTLCAGGFIEVGPTIYNESNPTGQEVLVAAGGCDSIVNVDLSFLPVPIGEETYTGCTGDGYFVDVNGTIYDEFNPSGQETITSPDGCDSTVMIDLTFLSDIQVDLDTTLCEGEFIVVNGTTYDASNPSGIEVFSGNGCDSIVTVSLFFEPQPEGLITYQGCTGDGYSIEVNGTIYNEGNPTGQETVAAPFGCDSLISIDLDFYSPSTETISYSGCLGDGYSVEVNGTIYDQSNPTGVETMQSAFGCDSVINVELMFGDTVFNMVQYTGCTGDGYSVTVNGTVYDESNPVGTETFSTPGSCDTVVNIQLEFLDDIQTEIDTTLCAGDAIVVNGTTYDSTNTSGTEVFSGTFCDSVVVVSVSFYPVETAEVNYTGCTGDGYEVNVNGTVYNELNPQGTEILLSSVGCDSVVSIELKFESCCTPVQDTLQASICAGESYDFMGQTYSATGIYTDTLPDAVAPGCDSIRTLMLEVEDVVTEEIDLTICDGESITFGPLVLTAEGVYRDTIENGASGGCDSVAILNLSVQMFPDVDAGPQQMITCADAQVALSGSGSADSLQWVGPDINNTNISNWNPVVTQPGWYWLFVTSPAGCRSVDSTFVDAASDVPVIDAQVDGMITCEREVVNLSASVTGDNVEISWTGPQMTADNMHQLDHEISQPGMYVLVAVDTVSLCYAAPDTIFIEDLRAPITAEITGEQDLTCENTSVDLYGSGTVGPTVMHLWEDQIQNVVAYGDSLYVSQAGMYVFLVVDTTSGCLNKDSVVIEDVKETPPIAAGDDQSLDCRNSIVTLNPDPDNIEDQVLYSWSGPSGAFVTDPEKPTVDVNQAGTYYLTAVDTINMCQSIDSVFVSDDTDQPLAEAGDDHLLSCSENSAELSVEGSHTGQNIRYIWNGPGISDDTAAVIVTSQEGMYFLTVVNLNTGCESTDSVTVTTAEAIEGAFVEYISPECANEPGGVVEIVEVTGGTPPYTYSLNGNAPQSDNTFDNLMTGMYQVNVQDAFGCTWESEIFIEDGIDLDLDIGPDLEVRLGQTMQLISELNVEMDQIDSIVWSPAEFLSCTNCFNPVLTATAGEIIVTAVAYRGQCFAQDQLLVSVSIDPDTYIPNVFSPNGDGINDHFTIYADEEVREIVEMSIYDRWGEEIYRKSNFAPNDESEGWKGTFRNQYVAPGVYVYSAELMYLDGSTVRFSGDVTVIR